MVSRKTAPACVVLSGALLGACGTRAAVDAPEARPELRVSLRPGGLLTAFHNLPQFSVRTIPIGDSQKRLEALQDGSIDVTNAVADVTFLASYGRSPDHSSRLQKIRGIALMNRAIVHLLIGPNVDARHGLRGLRVVLGDPAGGNSALGERLVNSMGVPTSAIHGEFAPYEIAVDKLLKGDVDAVIATAQPPEGPIGRALRGGAHLMEIKGPDADRLSVHYPLLRRTLLPPGTYPGQDTALHTVGVDLLLVCRADLDADLVYRLTRALFEEIPKHARRDLDPHRAPATVIPLHPGAARYYREREMQR